MSYFTDSVVVKELSPSDFSSGQSWRLRSRAPTAVLYYADWCHFCKETRPIWEKVARKGSFMDWVAFNCAFHVDHCNKIKEELPELIKGYPTIVFYRNGRPYEQFDDQRSEGNLLKWALDVFERSESR